GHLADAAAHELADLLYEIVTGHGRGLQTSARNQVGRLLRARRTGREHTLPRVADLLARPDFAALRDWLAVEQVDLDQLQQDVDAFIAQCRQRAEQDSEEKGTP